MWMVVVAAVVALALFLIFGPVAAVVSLALFPMFGPVVAVVALALFPMFGPVVAVLLHIQLLQLVVVLLLLVSTFVAAHSTILQGIQHCCHAEQCILLQFYSDERAGSRLRCFRAGLQPVHGG